jgi:hypothetical protein
MTTLLERAVSARKASCTCQTKTPKPETHEEGCRYRVLCDLASELGRKYARISYLKEQLCEMQTLASRLTERHDKLKAGEPCSFPTPADLPEALRTKDALITELVTALETYPHQTHDSRFWWETMGGPALARAQKEPTP